MPNIEAELLYFAIPILTCLFFIVPITHTGIPTDANPNPASIVPPPCNSVT